MVTSASANYVYRIFFVYDKVYPDRFVEREILNLTCKCEFSINGCAWVGLVKHYEEHIEQCSFTQVECPFEGCSQTVPKAYLDDHKSKCDYRRQICRDCGEEVAFSRLRKHQQTTCTGTNVKCSFCGKDLLRGQLKAHEERECTEAPSPCPFSKIGCAATRPLTKSDKRKHMENGLSNHITYLLNFSLSLSEKLSSVVEPPASRAHGAHEMMEVDILPEIPTDIQKAKRQPALAPTKPRPGRIVSDSSPDLRYSSLPSEMASSSHTDYSKVIDEMLGKVEAIKLDFDDKLERLGRSFDALMDLVKRLERRVTSYENVERSISEHMAELSEKFDNLESANYNGVLVWPITGFTAKRHDAIVGKKNSIYSPYFYTGRHGYKMRLRVYLNGDGMGKGTHISLFFVLCMGSYDALLSWPFKHKVKLMILDQDQNNDVTESFKPDPSSSSFQRPKNPMNIASGCPLFMPLSLLDTDAYVRDDTVFFKVEIDASN